MTSQMIMRRAATLILGTTLVAGAGTSFAFDMGNMMNPSKWMGGGNDRDDYYDDYDRWGGPGYGYGGPGYGYGGPGYGYGGPGYGYGGPGYGYGGPGYGYGGPGYGYGGPAEQRAPARPAAPE
ncbi:MAG: hypothetical protein U9Q81_00160 [Pseudomonadota bacterium]|nr:hypothetical protein [Pseudomonadota bacterium]